MRDLEIHHRARHKSFTAGQDFKKVDGVLCEDEALRTGLDGPVDETREYCSWWCGGRLGWCITEDGFAGDVAQC